MNGGGIIPGNPANEAYRQRLFAQLAAAPPELRGFIGQQYADTEIVLLPLPYWSTVRFLTTRAAGPPVAFTIDTTQRRAFAYAIGQDMTVAGFAAGTIATAADTNLLAASQTRDNADVWIWGIACNLQPNSEPTLAARLWRETDISISLNGTTTIPLGTPEMFPGAGGLYGRGTTGLRTPDLFTAGAAVVAEGPGEGAQIGFVTNGNPQSGNAKKLPQPFKWSAIGTAGADSSLSITFTPRRAITESMTSRAAVAGAAPGASGRVEAATAPAAAGDAFTFVDVRVQLLCVAVQRRSVNT